MYTYLTSEVGLRSYFLSVQRIYPRLPLGQQEILLQLPGIKQTYLPVNTETGSKLVY